jgi:hypothetical protein
MRLSFLSGCGAAVLMAMGACSSGVGPPPDGGSHDATVYDLALNLPDGCPPAAAQANEKGVGLPCTRNGNECAKTSSNLVCACDTIDGVTLVGVPCICTLAGLNVSTTNPNPCQTQPAGLCGSNATCCGYMTEAYYCSPNVCLPGGACIDFSAADGGS